MLSNLQSSISGSGKITGSLQVTSGTSIKAVLSEKMGLTGSIGAMNLYDYYTKEEVHNLFGEVVTMKKQSYYDFPNVGDASMLYIDLDAGSTYVWDTFTNTYICIGKDYEKINSINGGNANE